MNHQQQLTAYLHSFIQELIYNGVEHAVISPGSRSTPLALLMAEHNKMNIHVHVDERSAAFFALGIAKASKKPTVLLCTSGTAAANYLPAIVEAKISRIPLIVLTADRPHELRDVGAPQAIDQLELYGNKVKWFMEMSPPDASKEMIRYVKTVSSRAVSIATQEPKGPVHLNLPFREPLIPDFDHIEQYIEKDKPYIQIENGTLMLHETQYQQLADKTSSYSNGIIVCGEINSEPFSTAVCQLAKKLNFPILADPLSQLRNGDSGEEYIIDTYDTFLRNESVKKLLKPDIIIRFGSMPVSKSLTQYLKSLHAHQLVIDGGGGFRDPNQVTSEMIYCDEVIFCEKLVNYLKDCSTNHEIDRWRKINSLTKKAIDTSFTKIDTLSESKLFHIIGDLLPEDATLFVGNSMPIRDLDSYFHYRNKKISIYANRGANGIDGIVSTALGVGKIKQPLYLAIGDLTLFHDLNGLIASKQQDVPITIFLINNNGGGIFSFLPQAEHPKHFELLFGTPLNIDFKHIINMYNGQYHLVKDWSHLMELTADTAFYHGIRLIEIRTNREDNLVEHRDIIANVSWEIESFIKEELHE